MGKEASVKFSLLKLEDGACKSGAGGPGSRCRWLQGRIGIENAGVVAERLATVSNPGPCAGRFGRQKDG